VAIDSEGRLYVALAGAVIKRSSDGGRTFSEFVRLRFVARGSVASRADRRAGE